MTEHGLLSHLEMKGLTKYLCKNMWAHYVVILKEVVWLEGTACPLAYRVFHMFWAAFQGLSTTKAAQNIWNTL